MGQHEVHGGQRAGLRAKKAWLFMPSHLTSQYFKKISKTPSCRDIWYREFPHPEFRPCPCVCVLLCICQFSPTLKIAFTWPSRCLPKETSTSSVSKSPPPLSHVPIFLDLVTKSWFFQPWSYLLLAIISPDLCLKVCPHGKHVDFWYFAE